MKNTKPGDSVKEIIHYELMERLFIADKNLTIEQLLFLMLQDETCRTTKSRMKKELLETYEKLNKKLNLNSRSEGQKVVIDILKNIGIYES